MKNLKVVILFISLLLLFGNCSDAPDTAAEQVVEKTKPASKNFQDKITAPTEEGDEDFWTENGCTRSLPEATIHEANRNDTYTFEMNKQQGFGKEEMVLDNGYKMGITNKGCNSIVVAYTYFLPESDLNVQDKKAVSSKVLDLIKMTGKISAPLIELDSKIIPLQGAVEQIGPFMVGSELIVKDGEVKEAFILDRVEAKNGKVLLSYYFTKGPV